MNPQQIEMDVLMPGDNAVEQMHIILLRQLVDNVSASNDALRELQDSNLKVLERIIKIEGAELDAKMARLEAAVRELENARQRAVGAQNLVSWMKDYTPWLIALAAGVYAYITKK